jgi:putative pyruvate formate lyase activating enzyme
MHRQVGDLMLDERGIAQRGLLVRHLVLPDRLAGTAEVVRFLAALSPDTYLNIMDQYRPCYKAFSLPPLDRRVSAAEYQEAVRLAHEAGLHRLDDRVRLRWI